MDNAAARQAGAVCEALIVQVLLAPLSRGDAALGDAGTAYLAQAVAAHDARGFGAAIASVLAGRHV